MVRRESHVLHVAHLELPIHGSLGGTFGVLHTLAVQVDVRLARSISSLCHDRIAYHLLFPLTSRSCHPRGARRRGTCMSCRMVGLDHELELRIYYVEPVHHIHRLLLELVVPSEPLIFFAVQRIPQSGGDVQSRAACAFPKRVIYREFGLSQRSPISASLTLKRGNHLPLLPSSSPSRPYPGSLTPYPSARMLGRCSRPRLCDTVSCCNYRRRGHAKPGKNLLILRETNAVCATLRASSSRRASWFLFDFPPRST